MRRFSFLHSAVLFLAAFPPAVVCAQFQQPSDAELKMTSDPKAPGADAVYLNIEEICNDPMHLQSYYARIKVLTEKGKELATVEVPYLKGGWRVTDIRGRTIHTDGTVVPLIGKPEDVLKEKRGERELEQKVFTLPSVEVGSILEYSYSLTPDKENIYSSPTWEIQRPYFVHKAHYSFTPFKDFMPNGSSDVAPRVTSRGLVDGHGRAVHSLIWWQRLPPGVTVKTSVSGSFTSASGSYDLDVTDIPPIPDEQWMPPIRNLLFKVEFYYSFALNPTDFWMSESKFWSNDVDKFAEPSDAIKNAVNGLIAPGDSDLDKAKKLYAAVQSLDNLSFSRKIGATEREDRNIKLARRAEDTWAQKSGSRENIAMLYLAMLRAAGLTAYAVRVVDRDQGTFDVSYQSLAQLNSTVVALSIGGNEIFLDPAEKMCPFGMLHWRHSDATGIGQSAQGTVVTTTPAQIYKDNVTARSGDLTLDAQGGITGNVQIAMTGQEALHWRQTALRIDDAELKKRFDDSLAGLVPVGVEAHVDHFLGLDQPDQKLMAVVYVKGSVGAVTAKHIVLPALFFETRGNLPFVSEEKRLEPVDIHYADRVIDDVAYHLPPSLAVEGGPQDASVVWQGHATFILKSKAKPGQIEIANSLARGFTLVKADEYSDLRGFYQKVAAADQAQLVLDLAPAAKSN